MTDADRKTLEALANKRDNDRHAHAERQEFSAYTLAVNDAAAIRSALAEIDELTKDRDDAVEKNRRLAEIIATMPASERSYFGGPTLVQAAESARDASLALRARIDALEAVMGAPVERVDPSAVAAEARRLRAENADLRARAKETP